MAASIDPSAHERVITERPIAQMWKVLDRTRFSGDRPIEKKQFHTEELQWARRHLLLVEKGEVIDAFRYGVLSQAIQEKLLADIDAQLLRLESGETNESIEQKPPPDCTDGHNSVE